MFITKEFLESKRACTSGKEWVTENNLIGLEATDFLSKLIEADKLEWANWLIVRVMDRKQYLAYAIFAAEQVIDIYENKYPENKKPRLAIEAAKKFLEDDSKENRAAAYAAAADAAYAAADAAYAAADAAYAAAADADAAYAAAADAAYAAAAAAYAAAADAAYAAADAAADAAYAAAAADAADAARKEMRIRILNFGINLLK